MVESKEELDVKSGTWDMMEIPGVWEPGTYCCPSTQRWNGSGVELEGSRTVCGCGSISSFVGVLK